MINTWVNPAEEFMNTETGIYENSLNQNIIDLLLTPEILLNKRSMILNRINNGPKAEQEFRKTCIQYNYQKSDLNPELKKAYNEYVSAYYKIASLYTLCNDLFDEEAILCVYSTETIKGKVYQLKNSKLFSFETSIALLPNGELFCFGDRELFGTAAIINSDYNKIRVLPSGIACGCSSVVYFNRNVYCFGGIDYLNSPLNTSSRFDLTENRWVKLPPMPIYDFSCHSTIANRNIFISGHSNMNLLLYSIDIESFSTIPYKFAKNARKVLINAEKLYLIECTVDPRFIYESEDNDGYDWKKIGNSAIWDAQRIYCSYNKGSIYVITENWDMRIYEFNLGKKEWSNRL